MMKVFLALPILWTAGGLDAAELLTPVSATQSGAVELGVWGGAALQDNVIDNSGLSGVPALANYNEIVHAAATSGNAWTTEQANGNGDYFAAGSPGPAAVWTFTFDRVYALTDLVVWGYHFGAANGNEAREFAVEFSVDGGSAFSAPLTVSLPLGEHAALNAATLSFGGMFEAGVVRVSITDNQWGGGVPGGDRLGLGEIKFIGGLPVRDPSLEVNPAALMPTSNGSVVPLQIEITNGGAAHPLTISSVTVEGEDAGFFVNLDYPSTVGPGVTDVISLEFDPGFTGPGPVEAELVIESDDRILPVVRVPIAGLMRDPWARAASPVIHGPVPHGGPLQTIPVVVENLGLNGSLEMVAAYFPDDPLGAFEVLSNFEGILRTAPGSTETLEVGFDPTGLHGGLYSSTLEILLVNDPATLALRVEVAVTVEPLQDTLVGWWPLDGDASDASGHGHHGASFGVVDFNAPGATAKTGTAASFDGDARIEIAQDEALNRSSFTLAAWAKPATAARQFQAVATSRHDRHQISDNTYGFIVYQGAAGAWEFWTGTKPGADPWEITAPEDGEIVAGKWVHLAVTYDAVTGEKILYENGVPAAANPVHNYQPNLANSLHLGAGGDLGNLFRFSGDLDDVAIWCEALTGSEVATVMEEGVGGFLEQSRQRLDLAVGGLDPETGNLQVTVSRVPGAGDSVFHLRASTDGQTFLPLPGTEFSANRTFAIGLPAPNDAGLFLVQAFEGPITP